MNLTKAQTRSLDSVGLLYIFRSKQAKRTTKQAISRIFGMSVMLPGMLACLNEIQSPISENRWFNTTCQATTISDLTLVGKLRYLSVE
jgi:hypothetical protein